MSGISKQKSQINTFANSKISYLCSKLFEKKVYMLITEYKDTKIQRAAQRKTLCLYFPLVSDATALPQGVVSLCSIHYIEVDETSKAEEKPGAALPD